MLNIPAGWKPIESAPKTGRTLLLGYWNSHGKWRTVRGQWMSAEYIGKEWDEPDGVEAGWFETAVEADDVPNCWPVTPSHWQPMPAPPCRTCNDQGAVGNILTAEPCPDCTPAPSAPGDAQDERQAFEAWAKRKKMPLARIGQQYDDFWVDHAWNGWQARARLSAPAAGDALDAVRWRSFRKAITQRDEEWLNRMDSALTAMGLDPEGAQLPSDEQVDAAADLARQHKGDA